MRKYYYGGVYIVNETGGATLKDMYGSTTDQTLVDQTIATAPATLKIRIYEANHAKLITPTRLTLQQVHIGYADTVGADQLNEVYLLSGVNANEFRQREKVVWSDIDGVAEGLTSYITPAVGVPTPTPIDMANMGELYFITNWGTIIDINAAGEYFFLRVVLTFD